MNIMLMGNILCEDRICASFLLVKNVQLLPFNNNWDCYVCNIMVQRSMCIV